MTSSLIALVTAASPRSRGILEMLPLVVVSLIWFSTFHARHGNNPRNTAAGVWFPILMLATACLIAIHKAWWLSLPLPLAALALLILLVRLRRLSKA